METIYNGKPLVPGKKIVGTSLTFVRPILRRRGEFECVCGKRVPISIIKLENGQQKTCGCKKLIRNLTIETLKNRRINK